MLRIPGWIKNRLTVKVIGVTLVLLLVVLLASGLNAVRSERRVLLEQIDAHGTSLTEAASISCIEPLLSRDYPVLDTYVENIAKEKNDVVFARIERKDGKVVAVYPPDAGAHASGGVRVYTAPIRVSPGDPNALGRVVVGLSTHRSDALLASRFRALIIQSSLSFLVLAVLLSLWLRKTVTHPLRVLDRQSEILGRGRLEVPVTLPSSDELGRLACTLDTMRVNLGRKVAELENMTRELHLEIEERKKTEVKLKKAKEAAELASLLKSRFLANMSHEIRTPMTAILGYTDLLSRRQDTDIANFTEWAQQIRHNSNYLLSLLNDILDLSKIEAGQMSLSIESASPVFVIEEIASLMRPAAIQKGIKFKVAYETAVPRTIKTDPVRLQQILVNLTNNAIKFTEEGEVTLRARLDHKTDPTHCRLELAVVDTGIGIEKDRIDSLFNAFTQAYRRTATGKNYGGTGLGLDISRRLARLLGGDIVVESEPGRGSTFTLILDVGRVQDIDFIERTEIQPVCAERNKPVDENISLQGVRILVVEDGEDNQKIIRYLLEEVGAEVAIAENGAEGVEATMKAWNGSQPFDLVLMDMQMPVMDGYTATALLRRKGMDHPVVALTAHAMAGDKAKCLDAGCTDYIRKPINTREFFTVILKHLGAHEQLRGAKQRAEAGAGGGKATSLANDPKFEPFLRDYLAMLDRIKGELGELYEARQRDGLIRKLHKLKGSAGNYGFPEISHRAGTCERILKDHATVEAVKEPLHELIGLLVKAGKENAAGLDPAKAAGPPEARRPTPGGVPADRV